MKKSDFFLSFALQLVCLGILLHTVNCGCVPIRDDYAHRVPRQLPRPVPSKPQDQEAQPIGQGESTANEQHGEEQPDGGTPNDVNANNGKPWLLVYHESGEQEITDKKKLNLGLINQGKQTLNLAAIKTIITLHEIQNFSQQSSTEGSILVYNKANKALSQPGAKEIRLPLTHILQVDQLAPGVPEKLALLLVDSDQIASAKVTVQIKDQQDHLLATNTTVCKFSPKVGPFPGKSKISPQLNFQKTKLQGEILAIPINFINHSDHPIDLKAADYKLEIFDKTNGNQEYASTCLGENVEISHDEAILKQGASIQLNLKDFQIDVTDLSEILKKPTLEYTFIIMHKTTREHIGKVVGNIRFQAITAAKNGLIIEVDESTVAIKAGEGGDAVLQFNITLSNKSGYVINVDPRKVSYCCKVKVVDEGTTVLLDKTFSGRRLMRNQSKLIFDEQTHILDAIEFPLQGFTEEKAQALLAQHQIVIQPSIQT